MIDANLANTLLDKFFLGDLFDLKEFINESFTKE